MNWLVVTGGAHERGGQDRANLELARYLSQQALGQLHVVTHEVDSDVARAHELASSSSLARFEASSCENGFSEPLPASSLRLRAASLVLANGRTCAGAHVNWVHGLDAV